MDAITIRIYQAEAGGYMYDIYKGDAIEEAYTESLAPDSDDGGMCTTTMQNALGMAVQQATAIIRQELGEQCPGCWKDTSAVYCTMCPVLKMIVCPDCRARAQIEGDFISER